jgi:carboxymethylenebutenolidase
MASRWIDIAGDGGKFGAYLSLPPTGKGPGLVVIQEIFGVNAHIRSVADQYALDGYTVLAPDIFWRNAPRVELGYGEKDFGAGFELYQKTDFGKAVTDLTATVKALRALPECTGKVGSLGFCMGGLLSFLAAANAGVDAAVCYYGGGIGDQLGQVGKIRCPILLHFAEKDGFIPLTVVEATKKAFAGRTNATVQVYPGVDHGFNCWERVPYNQRASALAHGRSLQFLSETLS